ncbi:uncharacterized protein N7477_004656 [Penicillium maclennaniae]|uniref:uncharacterized protein n=1 Tax=Penicillium maclennaniae TaxID=1343394 RepID=UPI00254210BC|nr:uncharacterized protein N7477_004656 [Penicillium maclennaniae]KAJ5674722.1 hypothetical protein N7477_004656 [Penicillium maclennaniae]
MSLRNAKPISQIAIIGVGQVGAAAAYALILQSVASELLLVDVKMDLRDSQARDLSDVCYSCNSETRVRAATHQEASQSDIVVVTVGSKFSTGETSVQYMYQKISIIRSVVNTMKPFKSDAILLLVANPVDLLTSIAQELSGLPRCQVLGSGTFLDSVRIRGLLAEKTGVAANSIDLYVVGVHGDSQVVPWSDAIIGGVPIQKLIPLNTLDYDKLIGECKSRTQKIIHAKGTTPFGIGSVISNIASSILSDKRNICPISHFQPEWGCCFSLPVVLGRAGIIKTMQMPMNSGERAALEESVKALKGTMEKIHEDH